MTNNEPAGLLEWKGRERKPTIYDTFPQGNELTTIIRNNPYRALALAALAGLGLGIGTTIAVFRAHLPNLFGSKSKPTASTTPSPSPVKIPTIPRSVRANPSSTRSAMPTRPQRAQRELSQRELSLLEGRSPLGLRGWMEAAAEYQEVHYLILSDGTRINYGGPNLPAFTIHGSDGKAYFPQANGTSYVIEYNDGISMMIDYTPGQVSRWMTIWQARRAPSPSSQRQSRHKISPDDLGPPQFGITGAPEIGPPRRFQTDLGLLVTDPLRGQGGNLVIHQGDDSAPTLTQIVQRSMQRFVNLSASYAKRQHYKAFNGIAIFYGGGQDITLESIKSAEKVRYDHSQGLFYFGNDVLRGGSNEIRSALNEWYDSIIMSGERNERFLTQPGINDPGYDHQHAPGTTGNEPRRAGGSSTPDINPGPDEYPLGEPPKNRTIITPGGGRD